MDTLIPDLAAVALDSWTVIGGFVVLSILVARVVGSVVDPERYESLLERRGVAPVGAAVLGAIPGCGGAIAVVTLYGHGSVGFGALVAALIATAGDSAFLLLAVAPKTALIAYGIAFVTAVVVGTLVEFDPLVDRLDVLHRGSRTVAVPDGGSTGDARSVEAGADSGGRLRPGVGALVVLWWLAALVGVTVGLTRLATDTVPVVLPGAPVGVPTVAAVLGVGLSAVVYALPEGTVGSLAGEGRWQVPLVTTVEASRIIVWIAAGLGGYRVLVTALDVGWSGAAVTGSLAAVTGGLIGALPGCAVHVGVVTAYVEGALPFAALVANAISQDGDALFALFAVDRVAAVVATVYTTVAAVGVGLVVVAL